MKRETEWKTWALGILFTVVMSTSGMVCSTLSNRIDKVEAAQAEDSKTARDVAVQIAVLQETMKTFAQSVNNLESSQAKLMDKIEVLMSGIARDSKRWNAEMDRLQRERKQ